MSVRMYVCPYVGFWGKRDFTGLELSYRFQTFSDYSFEASLLMDVFILVLNFRMRCKAKGCEERDFSCLRDFLVHTKVDN